MDHTFGLEQFPQVAIGLFVVLDVLDHLQVQESHPHEDERGPERRPEQGVTEILRGAGGLLGPLPLPPAEP